MLPMACGGGTWYPPLTGCELEYLGTCLGSEMMLSGCATMEGGGAPGTGPWKPGGAIS